MSATKTCTLCDGCCIVAGRSCPRCRGRGYERTTRVPEGYVDLGGDMVVLLEEVTEP